MKYRSCYIQSRVIICIWFFFFFFFVVVVVICVKKKLFIYLFIHSFMKYRSCYIQSRVFIFIWIFCLFVIDIFVNFLFYLFIHSFIHSFVFCLFLCLLVETFNTFCIHRYISIGYVNTKKSGLPTGCFVPLGYPAFRQQKHVLISLSSLRHTPCFKIINNIKTNIMWNFGQHTVLLSLSNIINK